MSTDYTTHLPSPIINRGVWIIRDLDDGCMYCVVCRKDADWPPHSDDERWIEYIPTPHRVHHCENWCNPSCSVCESVECEAACA